MAGALIRRGSFVIAAFAGDYGKPRPGLVVQSDLMMGLPSVLLCPLTSTLREDIEMLRIRVDPGEANGLREPSQIAIDKIVAIPRAKIGQVIGQADAELMVRVDRALTFVFGLT